MEAKVILIIVTTGLIWLIQLSSVEATQWHSKQLLPYFRRIKLDKTKNSVYQHTVKDAIRMHLRIPLMQKALCLPKGTKVSKHLQYADVSFALIILKSHCFHCVLQLSSDCLNRMVDKARQHENKFYARFTYACKTHAEYSSDCMESGRPMYYRNLRNLVKQTEKCWKL
uniref:SG7-2 n=1 Tax=Anopheles funestus TaxID=62324 RepID=I4AWS3_ANOFN|nr:SG7-2 [Anopheles funestus]